MLRTDLAIEAKEFCNVEKIDFKKGVAATEEEYEGIKINAVEIKNQDGERALGKPQGHYVTLTMPQFEKIGTGYYNCCVKCLKEQIIRLAGKEKPFVFVVGLGNRSITADAIGPLVTDGLIVTHHLHSMKLKGIDALGDVSAISPGVLGITGIESAHIIKSIASFLKPDVIICIDSLVARDVNRLATTIQLSDTGISPGSGIGNRRCEISRKTTGVKVIALGVPMVTEAATLAHDAISDCFNKELYEKIKAKTKELTVTPKDVDSLVKKMSAIIASGINLAFNDIPAEDLYLYS